MLKTYKQLVAEKNAKKIAVAETVEVADIPTTLAASADSTIENKSSAFLGNTPIENYSNTTLINIVGNNSFVVEKLQNGTTNDIYAIIGDVIDYKVIITNQSIVTLPFKFEDILDARLAYVVGSFTVNGATETPTISGQTLTYFIDSIASNGGVATIEFKATII